MSLTVELPDARFRKRILFPCRWRKPLRDQFLLPALASPKKGDEGRLLLRPPCISASSHRVWTVSSSPTSSHSFTRISSCVFRCLVAPLVACVQRPAATWRSYFSQVSAVKCCCSIASLSFVLIVIFCIFPVI